MGRWQPLQKAGVNFTGRASALTTYPKKGRADKQKIIHVDNPSDVSNMNRNINERMTLEEPWIGYKNNNR